MTKDLVLSLPNPAPGLAWIYAIPVSDDLIKVGRTDNLLRRLKTFQTAHAKDLHVVDFLETTSGRAAALERRIHREISHHRESREIFRITEDQIRNLFVFARIRWVDDALLDL